jgi:hypothetical protein
MKYKPILVRLVLVTCMSCSALLVGVTIHQAKAMPSNQEQQAALQPNDIFLPCILKACVPLYFDNFSNPSSGWLIKNDADELFAYTDGEYQILVRSTNWATGDYPGFQASDYYASVDLRNPNIVFGSYGIAFGISQGWNTFYTFEIYPDGWFGIYRIDPVGYQTLAEAFSASLNQGSATNQIKLARSGDSITAYANGQLLASVIDGTYTGSLYIGLDVVSQDEQNLDIRFDNFQVDPITCPGTQLLQNSSVNLMPTWSSSSNSNNRYGLIRHQP